MNAPDPAQARRDAAKLTPSRLITIHRLMAHEGWSVFFDWLKANFPLNEAVFVPGTNGAFDPYAAAKRDGQRDVMLAIALTKDLPTPGETEEANTEL